MNDAAKSVLFVLLVLLALYVLNALVSPPAIKDSPIAPHIERPGRR